MTDIDARRTLEVWLAGKRETVGNIAEAAESVLAELARLARERDAYLSRLVWSNGDGRWWSTAVNVENPGQHTKQGQSLFDTYEAAVTALNKELGLSGL